MRVVIQRSKQARVEVEGRITGQIEKGFVVLLGVEPEDTTSDADWLAQKIVGMRVFADAEGKMNRDIKDDGGDVLVISQFTLHASTKKGNRPSFIRAARPEHAIPMYEYFIQKTEQLLGRKVQTGEFGAMMDVHLVNDGPVTITMDSKNPE